MGGNLTLIIHLLAAGRLSVPAGALFFFEDVDEAPYRLDRMLTTLRLAGSLDRLLGPDHRRTSKLRFTRGYRKCAGRQSEFVFRPRGPE